MRILSVVTLAISVLVATDAVGANCRYYTNRLQYTGKLAIGESRIATEWQSTCDGAINASAALGHLTLLRETNGVWQVVKDGISTIVPRAAAGHYRLVVRNPYGIPYDYRVGVMYGAG